MAVKCGKFVLPSGGTFPVTGVGFKPRWIIILFSTLTAEDAWNNADYAAGMGWTALQNSDVDDSSLRASEVSEIWRSNGVGSRFTGNIMAWAPHTRSDVAPNGYAFFPDSLNDDGFALEFSGGYTIGAAGSIVYYLAGSEEYEQVGSALPFVPGMGAYTLGWRPDAFFGVGHGGGVGAFGGLQNFGLVDQSMPAAVAGDWIDEIVTSGIMNGVWRGILDPNVDVQEWWGYVPQSNVTTILEPTQSAGAQFSTQYTVGRTATTINPGFNPDSFGGTGVRMQMFMLGTTDSIVGSFMPSTTVGVPTEIELPFSPEAVVFFSPQDHRSGIFNTDTQGATGWGFCTEEDQALLIYGGFWNPGSGPNWTRNALISSSNCWVSNCIDTLFSVGSNVTMGSAQVTPAGFAHTTTEHNSAALYPIHYWAFAPANRFAPGFFRII